VNDTGVLQAITNAIEQALQTGQNSLRSNVQIGFYVFMALQLLLTAWRILRYGDAMGRSVETLLWFAWVNRLEAGEEIIAHYLSR
jgi:hypothetical protein